MHMQYISTHKYLQSDWSMFAYGFICFDLRDYYWIFTLIISIADRYTRNGSLFSISLQYFLINCKKNCQVTYNTTFTQRAIQ